MDHSHYTYYKEEAGWGFYFKSTGVRTLMKKVEFQRMPFSDFYNLALGDVDENGEMDISSVSDNGDMRKVLATIIHIVAFFLEANPQSVVYIQGSSNARTRLYQIVISRELQIFNERFVIAGYNGTTFEMFEPNGEYAAFAISLKKS